MVAPVMVNPALLQPSEDGADLRPSLVVEVEREIFLGLLKQPEKPLVLVHHAGFPKTFRYYFRYGGYFFLYRSREAEDLSAHATELPVKALHASPAMVG